MEEGNLIAKGIVRDKGIIWDCQFTFSKSDIPGLLHMLLSGPVLLLFLKNFVHVITFGYVRFIKGGASKAKAREKPKAAVQAEGKAGS